jgi:small subunit ribosomal protein S4e
MKAHLKRLSMPKTWDIDRKSNTFIMRPHPSGVRIELAMPLAVVMREVLKFGKTTHDITYILNNKEILVNGIRRTEPKFPVGIMDVLEVPDEKLAYRLLINRKGMLQFVEIKKAEAKHKLLRILGKTTLAKGRVQLNCGDGTNLLVEKDSYRTNDTIVYDFEKKKVAEHLPLAKKAHVFLTGGKKVGDSGTVQDIAADTIIIKSHSGDVYETAKKYAFVVGIEKPQITLIP